MPTTSRAKCNWAWEHPHEMAEMGRNARREYEAKYTAERNYDDADEYLPAGNRDAQRRHADKKKSLRLPLIPR